MRYPLWTCAVVAGFAVLAPALPLAAAEDTARPSGDAAASDTSAAAAAEEGRALREQVRLLTERLEKAEQRIAQLEKPRKLADVPDFPLPGGLRGPDRQKLDKIKLPANSTREQAAAYVDQVIDATRGQNFFSDHDPQVAMLAAVGAEHVDLLIRRVGDATQYTVPAIARVVTDEHRDKVIQLLRQHPEVVSVVRAKGWEPEAKETLIATLKARPRFLPHGFVEAVASYQDPETYPLLLDQLARGLSPRMTYDAIAHLPGIDLDDAVAKAWGRVRRGGGGFLGMKMAEYDVPSFAPIAAAHGHADALDAMVDILRKKSDVNDPHAAVTEMNRDGAREGLRDVIDFDGSDDDMIKWLDENKDALRWNKQARKFALPAGRIG